ncbi:MAG: asparagine synthase (glutamine-hydrolyzing) [Acidobacteria bacterium]|nr:MAG: asparagine synthase (glutamine-hydrolyzing) [Acidobacteriota bacterium]
MCGIAGWAGSPAHPIERYLDAACGAMIHRGPDSEGRFIDRTGKISAGLGARRLAIIDIGGGDQPVENEDGSIAAVLNGEIYNFGDLRKALEASGHQFKSEVDTEILVHAYEEWGDDMLGRLNGMFAFAIWDVRHKRLFAARDRFGKKPFFWSEETGGIRFASELKALLADGAMAPRPDLVSLWALLALQYIPPNRSALRNVNSLPPAHALSWDAGKIRTWRWWDLWDEPSGQRSEAQPEALLEYLDEAVALRLKADVPLGVFLSGGIDSSLIAASMARAGGTVKTFSVGFEEADYSELPLARKVSEACGTEHTEIEVTWRDGSLIPEILFALDEPLADSSALPTFLVSRAASKELKVVLSGDGGDELFGGYERYVQFMKWNRLWRIAHGTRSEVITRPLGRAAVGIRPGGASAAGRIREVARRAGVAMRRASEAMPDRYLNFLGAFPTAERLRLAGPAFASLGGISTAPVSSILDSRWPFREDDLLTSLGALDIETELAGDILVKVDRMSMANSLEVRSPFLDHTLASWALRLPETARYAGDRTKPILRDAALLRLPRAVAEAPKRGFGIPLSLWLQTGLRPSIEDVLLDPRTSERGLFDRNEITRLLDEHRLGRANASRIWMLFAIEVWCRSYLDPPVPKQVTI